jgi:2-phosphosulfolactate phosphatase
VNIIHALLTPAELPLLQPDDLAETLCVVFDVLRATSTFVTALHQGAARVIPVGEIAAALAGRQTHPGALLAGERDGVKIGAAQTGGVNFDLGNSPREFAPEIVRGKTIISTTTNGTRALRACRTAPMVLAGSFLNLSATARFIERPPVKKILLVCAGTGHRAALEDVLGAGALCQTLLADNPAGFTLSDAAAIAWRTYRQAEPELAEVMRSTDNGRRLLAIPELSADVAFCARRDVFDLVAWQSPEGLIGLTPQTPTPAGAG